MFLLSLPMRERGLKFDFVRNLKEGSESLPMRGAWIEMYMSSLCASSAMSLPMRGVWIEILKKHSLHAKKNVAPHAGRGLKY